MEKIDSTISNNGVNTSETDTEEVVDAVQELFRDVESGQNYGVSPRDLLRK